MTCGRNMHTAHAPCLPPVEAQACTLGSETRRRQGSGILVSLGSTFLAAAVAAESPTQSCQTLCDPRDCSTPGLPVPHHLLKFAQVHVHCISGVIQPSHPLTPSFPSALSLSQHRGLFQWDGRLHQMTKILELQLQHQSFQRAFRVDFP